MLMRMDVTYGLGWRGLAPENRATLLGVAVLVAREDAAEGRLAVEGPLVEVLA